MLRFLITLIPLVLAVGCTFAALKLQLPGSEEDRATKLLVGAFALGVVCSLLIWWQQAALVDQAAEARRAASNNKASQAWEDAQSKGYEEKINSLNAEINELRSQLSKPLAAPQESAAGTVVKEQSTELPKIYWTTQNIGSGQTAVKFKVYGPLNIPAFVAICDRPCRAISGQIGTGSDGTQVVGATSNIAGYVFKKPRPIPAGTDGYVIVEPSSAAVTQFKILGDSEIPAPMR